MASKPTFDFSKPPGEPAYCAPDSVSWRVFKNQIALGVGGVAAVLLEFADPRIRSGVWDHSTYKQDPIGRSQRTGMAAMLGVYGPQNAARQVINGVNRMHAKVNGETPGGIAYRALDTDLLDWVSATAQWGFMTAYHNFVAPLTEAEQRLFFEEGEVIARLYGVEHPILSNADFIKLLERLVPNFEPHPINLEFLDIIQSGRAAPNVPKFLHRILGRAAVSILPTTVRARLELGRKFDLSAFDRMMLKLMATIAERRHDPSSPPAQASVRLGLPSDFLYRKPGEQRQLMQTL